MGQTWYMDNDMQLFLISPLLIYPLWKWRKPGLVWLFVVLLASLAANFAVFAIFDLPPIALPTRP
jgi:peptidoglycan/LPS O-acetylase OafA/YrhL